MALLATSALAAALPYNPALPIMAMSCPRNMKGLYAIRGGPSPIPRLDSNQPDPFIRRASYH